ncbi:MAG: trypsin-like serine protease [Clostridiales bacterium]|nr:trypsin-like serine protease [Clostridiales bacterium]
MKKLIPIMLSCILLTSCGNTTANMICGQPITIEHTTGVDLSDTLAPAIVGVGAISGSYQSLGAGVCISDNGYILTNSHVINSADNIVLHLSDGNTTTATLVYEDTVLDFAIIRSKINLPYLKINTDDLVVGQSVIAVGTPISLMLKHTFTKGIISALNRTIPITSTSGEAYMQNLIQHDASLNPGNSGGPLLNDKGEVIGINTLKISSGEGIGFAIPSRSFVTILQKVIKYGSVSAPYLGVYGYDSEIAHFNHLTSISSGFYIEDILDQSPASQHLAIGDTIVAINNIPISNASDFRHELYKYSHGDSITVEYIHDNIRQSATIILTKKYAK